MIDAPDRPSPRFPARLEPAIAAEIEAVLDRWDIRPADLLLLSGARGSDILFAESGHRRGSHIEIILASAPEVFEQTSVALPQSIWSQRFRYLLGQHHYTVSQAEEDDGAPNEFARANEALLRRARELAPPAELRVALVSDEHPAGARAEPVSSPSSPRLWTRRWPPSIPPSSALRLVRDVNLGRQLPHCACSWRNAPSTFLTKSAMFSSGGRPPSGASGFGAGRAAA